VKQASAMLYPTACVRFDRLAVAYLRQSADADNEPSTAKRFERV